MESNTIKISISGAVASGKTTVAELISQALAEKGFEVKLSDEQIEPFHNLGHRCRALQYRVPLIEVRTSSVMEGNELDSPVRERAVHTYMLRRSDADKGN
jgi:uridine kinase